MSDNPEIQENALQRAGIPLPKFLKKNHYFGFLGILLVYLLAGTYSEYSQTIMNTIIFAIIGASLIVVFGMAGQLTLGHTIFVAAGVFLSANITTVWSRGLETEIPIAFGVAFLLGLLIGFPSLRVNELYLALATFAVAFVGVQVLFEWKQFSGGGSGKPVGKLELFGYEFSRGPTLVRIALVLMLITFWIVGNYQDGRTGRAWNALRTSETAARAAGLPVAWLKILCFAIGGGLAAIGGVLYAHTLRFAIPENYGVSLSIIVVLALIIGGKHRLMGAVLGAAFVKWLPELSRDVQEYEGLIYGGTLIILTLIAPDGLVGMFEWLADRIKNAIPSNKDEIVGSTSVSASALPLESTFLAPLSSSEPKGNLIVRDAAVAFGGVKAVDGVSFEIPAGGVTGLIGSNGAGKTTLFNAITGHVKGATGQFILDGTEISQKPIHTRALAGVGRTFQNLNLHDDLNVLEHALLGLDRNIGYGRIAESFRLPWVLREERKAHYLAAELLDHMDLLEYWDEKVEDLPYGLQKRVDVVRALAANPSILLLDEPAAGLPTAEALEMMKKVQEYATHISAGVLIIEHNVELVADVSDRILVLDAGKTIADGTPEEVTRNEQVIAAYLGT
jgi:ABC-type branched-subunit amino acid transport system ATPase component/ABC-type branched-subunit amino acid transport system permease subunit